jgi:predicted Fe-Mo cluster-binding NifX family protein
VVQEENMKTAVPVIQDSEDSRISGHFGSAPFFAIFGEEKDELEYWSRKEQVGGHRCAPVDELLGMGVGRVISAGMGRGAMGRLSAANIAVRFVGDPSISLTELRRGLASDELTLSTDGGICLEHHGHGSRSQHRNGKGHGSGQGGGCNH